MEHTHPYQKLGGFLLFVVIANAFTLLRNVSDISQKLSALMSNNPYSISIPSLCFDIAMFIIGALILLLLLMRNHYFLLVINISYLISLASIIWELVYVDADVGIYVLLLILVLISLAPMSFYWCRSVRVRTYMSSPDYLRRSLFYFWVTPPNPIDN